MSARSRGRGVAARSPTGGRPQAIGGQPQYRSVISNACKLHSFAAPPARSRFTATRSALSKLWLVESKPILSNLHDPTLGVKVHGVGVRIFVPGEENEKNPCKGSEKARLGKERIRTGRRTKATNSAGMFTITSKGGGVH